MILQQAFLLNLRALFSVKLTIIKLFQYNVNYVVTQDSEKSSILIMLAAYFIDKAKPFISIGPDTSTHFVDS